MCIAIAKLKDRDLPSRELLENCWTNNPDGAGFAFNHKGMVHTKKGFMTFDAFMKALEYYNNKYDLKSRGVLLHFRIATHGAKDASMTHPFPVHSDEAALKKIEYISEFAAIHNGIISLTTSAATKSVSLSDTAIFVRDYLYPLSLNRGWFYGQHNIDLIDRLIDSKMALVNGNGDIVKTTGFHESEGVFYSNTSYKDGYVRSYARSSRYYDFDYGYNTGYSYNSGSTGHWDKEQNKYVYDDGRYWDSKLGKYIYPDTKKNTPTAGTVASGAGKSVNTIDDSTDLGVILMQCQVGDTIECDSFNEHISSYDMCYYYIDEYGQIFLGIRDEGDTSNSTYAMSFQYMGDGAFFNQSIQEKDFVKNGSSSHFIYEEQFVGGYSTPDEKYLEDADTPPFDTDDIPETAETAKGTGGEVVTAGAGTSAEPAAEPENVSALVKVQA